ncbi:MAG: hypothetical protein V4501_07870, partial [Pseudomonadota bacterium]
MQFLRKILAVGVVALLGLPACVYAQDSSNTAPSNTMSAPQEAYPLLYTLNAEYGDLVKSVNGYHITLHVVAPKVVYKNAAGKSGMVAVRQFVKHLQNKRAVIKADVSGVQSGKNSGQKAFYASFTLSKVVLSSREYILRFEAEPLKP